MPPETVGSGRLHGEGEGEGSESAAVHSLDAVDVGEEMLVRMHLECGREEVNNGEKQEKGNQTHIVDGMKMECVRATQTYWEGARLERAVSVHILIVCKNA